jgi:hypothetical protein
MLDLALGRLLVSFIRWLTYGRWKVETTLISFRLSIDATVSFKNLWISTGNCVCLTSVSLEDLTYSFRAEIQWMNSKYKDLGNEKGTWINTPNIAEDVIKNNIDWYFVFIWRSTPLENNDDYHFDGKPTQLMSTLSQREKPLLKFHMHYYMDNYMDTNVFSHIDSSGLLIILLLH